MGPLETTTKEAGSHPAHEREGHGRPSSCYELTGLKKEKKKIRGVRSKQREEAKPERGVPETLGHHAKNVIQTG